MDPKLFDKRVVRRNIDKNLISRKDYDKWLAGLDDMEDECEPVEVSLFPSDEEEEEKEGEEASAETDEADASTPEG